ncbi:MAG: hypothetical protein ACQGVK_06005 [Myxococcota bacterium]
MLKAGSEIFVRDPRREDRFLYRGRVAGIEGARCTVELDAGEVDLRSHDELLVYFHDEGDFLQQVMEIADPTGSELVLRSVGDPISADQREHDRTSTLTSDLVARLGEENDCLVQDVGPMGFAAVGPLGLRQGQVVDISLHFEGRCYVGDASVQSLREVGDGRARYGLRLLAQASGPGKPLVEALPEIRRAIQRSRGRLEG